MDGGAGHAVTGIHLDQRGDRQYCQHHHLDAEQPALDGRGQFDAAVADVGHHGHPGQPHQQHPAAARVAADAVGAEEQEAVLAGHLGQARHHQHVGGDDAPAAHPAGLRPESLGCPGEGGATVRLGLVQLLVAHRDEQDRNEGQQHHGRALQPYQRHDEAERGGQAVGRRGGGDADHHAGDQSERAALEALSSVVGAPGCCPGSCGHKRPHSSFPSKLQRWVGRWQPCCADPGAAVNAPFRPKRDRNGCQACPAQQIPQLGHA